MTHTPANDNNLSGLDRNNFQKDIGGKKTDLLIMTKELCMDVAATNYGCALLSMMLQYK